LSPARRTRSHEMVPDIQFSEHVFSHLVNHPKVLTVR